MTDFEEKLNQIKEGFFTRLEENNGFVGKNPFYKIFTKNSVLDNKRQNFVNFVKKDYKENYELCDLKIFEEDMYSILYYMSQGDLNNKDMLYYIVGYSEEYNLADENFAKAFLIYEVMDNYCHISEEDKEYKIVTEKSKEELYEYLYSLNIEDICKEITKMDNDLFFGETMKNAHDIPCLVCYGVTPICHIIKVFTQMYNETVFDFLDYAIDCFEEVVCQK